MKKVTFIASLLIALAHVAPAQPPDGVHLRVVIVRHGEKPATGDNLSCQGLNRALALPPVLYAACGTPGHTYVPTLKTGGKSTGHARMFQTVTPFAVQYNLTVNSKYAETDSAGVAKEVLTKKGVVLMVWEHHNIPAIARNLGVKGSLSWSGTDFDSMWVIDFTKDSKGKLKPTLDIQQEGLNPSSNCQ